MKISEVAKLTGITVRTLHYYDEIDLLKPTEVAESGYRIYSEESLERLQQILFFRELDFSLSEIKEIMNSCGYDTKEALNKHRELLIQKRQRIERLISLIDNTLKGENDMSFKAFDNQEIEAGKEKYAEEVRQRWGKSSAYKEYEKKIGSYDKDKWKAVGGEMEEVLQQFAACRQEEPGSETAQKLVESWKAYITSNFYNCTDEILAGLGLMYVQDERFKKNIDKYGEGTADFMAKAIEIYCSK